MPSQPAAPRVTAVPANDTASGNRRRRRPVQGNQEEPGADANQGQDAQDEDIALDTLPQRRDDGRDARDRHGGAPDLPLGNGALDLGHQCLDLGLAQASVGPDQDGDRVRVRHDEIPLWAWIAFGVVHDVGHELLVTQRRQAAGQGLGHQREVSVVECRGGLVTCRRHAGRPGTALLGLLLGLPAEPVAHPHQFGQEVLGLAGDLVEHGGRSVDGRDVVEPGQAALKPQHRAEVGICQQGVRPLRFEQNDDGIAAERLGDAVGGCQRGIVRTHERVDTSVNGHSRQPEDRQHKSHDHPEDREPTAVAGGRDHFGSGSRRMRGY